MIIEDSFKSVTPEDISDLEQKIDFRLPSDYKKFMLINNGGYPTPNEFVFTDGQGSRADSLIQYFLPIGQQFDDNIESLYKFFIEAGRLPIGMLPIAYDPFGNMVCIDLNAEKYGSVYFWDHELEFEENNLSVISNDFETFISILK